MRTYKFSSQYLAKQTNARGSVLLEFAIVVPLLVVFFFGISGVGQLLGHVTWISQTTYAAAMFAADVPQPDGPAKVALETSRLRGAQSRGQVNGNWDAPVYTVGNLTGRPIVSVSVPAHVTPLLNTVFPTNVGVSVAAPYLVPNESAFAGFNDFGNPPGVVTCVGAACNPPTPYDPGTKKLEVHSAITDLLPVNQEASNAALKAFKTGLMLSKDKVSTFQELLEQYGEVLDSDPELYKAVMALDPSAGLPGKGGK